MNAARRASLLLTVLVACAALAPSCARAGKPRGVNQAGWGSPMVTPTVLTARTYIEADLATVWEQFTRAEAYAAWSSAPCLEFGDDPGEPAVWGTPEQVVYRGEITRFENGSALGYTFRFEDAGFDEPPTPVDVRFEAAGPVVLVQVRHDCSGARQTAETIGALGWQKSLSRLKTLLETGTAMPWPED